MDKRLPTLRKQSLKFGLMKLGFACGSIAEERITHLRHKSSLEMS